MRSMQFFTKASSGGPHSLLWVHVLSPGHQLPVLLSVIAGMVDIIGFLNLGNFFTAHITGNLVVIAALALCGGTVNVAQILAIPDFILAVAAMWVTAKSSRRSAVSLTWLLTLMAGGR
jgi:uncharacterized membrane protein YoaK (UPF0700 family)